MSKFLAQRHRQHNIEDQQENAGKERDNAWFEGGPVVAVMRGDASDITKSESIMARCDTKHIPPPM